MRPENLEAGAQDVDHASFCGVSVHTALEVLREDTETVLWDDVCRVAGLTGVVPRDPCLAFVEGLGTALRAEVVVPFAAAGPVSLVLSHVCQQHAALFGTQDFACREAPIKRRVGVWRHRVGELCVVSVKGAAGCSPSDPVENRVVGLGGEAAVVLSPPSHEGMVRNLTDGRVLSLFDPLVELRRGCELAEIRNTHDIPQ